MSKLEKLQIQGFRSFCPYDINPGPQLISFSYSLDSKGRGACPLTLILGRNGCGKTTIIECLRYITSGDPPPGSNKGSTFVHDPKMARERDTIGTVKLSYRGTDGCLYTVMRSMQATHKGKTISCKTLDQTITKVNRQGVKKSLSGKCADINQTMFSTMGVSKAILNYVVFCHQEDSNWPLDEGSKVKAKFDEIFASTRYNGCLKNIKDVIQSHKDKVKLGKKDAEFYKENWKDARKKRNQLNMKVADQKQINQDLEAIQEELKPLETELHDVREVEQNFAGIQAKLTEAETNMEHYRKEIQDIRSHISKEIPVSTSNEEIRRKRRELDQEKEELAGDIEDKDHELKKVETQIRKISDGSKRIASEIGECKAMRNKYEKDRLDLTRNLRKVCHKYGWEVNSSSNDGPMNGEEMQDVIENLRGMLKVRREELNETEHKLQAEIDEKIEKASELTAQKAQLDEKQKGKRMERSECKKEIARIVRKLAELEGAESQLERLRDALDTKETELEKAQMAVNLDDLRSSLKADKAQLKVVESRVAEMQRDKQKMEAVRDQLLVIDSKKKDAEAKETALKKLLSKKNSELAVVFGDDAGVPKNPKDIKPKFLVKSRELFDEKKRLEDECRKLKAKQENSKDSRRNLVSERQRIEQRVAAFERSLELVVDTGSDTFDDELKQAKEDVEKTRLELQSKEANKFTFKEFANRLRTMKESKGQVQPSCPTCNRHFEEASEVDDLIAELNREVDKIPTKVNSIQKKLERSMKKVDQLQDLLPEKRQTDELKAKLGEIQEKVASHDRELKDLNEKISLCDDKLDVVGADYSVCDELNREEVVVRIGQLSDDALTIKAQIAKLEADIPASADSGSGNDYNKLLEEESKLCDEMRALRQKVETDQSTEIEHERKLNRLQKERNELFNKKLQIESNQQERAANEEKKSDLESKVNIIDQELDIVQRDLGPIANRLEKEQRAKSELESRKKSELQSGQRQIEVLRDMHKGLESDADNLKEYEESNNEDNLEKLEAERNKITRQLIDLDAKQKALRSERAEVEKKLSNHAGVKRNFDDNLKLRDYLKKETEMAAKVRKCEEQLNDLDFRTLKRKKEKAQRRWQDLDGQQLRLMGQQTELARTIEDIRKELDQDKMKNAEENYRKKTVELELRIHAAKDLAKYYSALEWAIMRFHRERMEQINKIVRELWKATYKGNDIDYIEIKTEDLDSLGGPDKLRKKINYYVVMVKNEVAMEMRGRCSAGQKVLASLIIRLALAETFSANCGMIALDEPTTNLDVDNIESLAESLIEIVEKRSRQHNFQLIIISHDNDLVEMLSKSDQVEHYWNVSRNRDGLSLIKKKHCSNR